MACVRAGATGGGKNDIKKGAFRARIYCFLSLFVNENFVYIAQTAIVL
jgi:hypothetical protein